jgi:D-alanyl-lipoteichoic acid acyltransferase DltB (MBOAT superfamily)
MDFRAGAISNPRLITFLTYIFYFPAWISGPITRYSHFANAEPKGEYRETYLIPGLKRIVLGMVKKNFVAEVIAPFALPFIDIHSASSGTIVLAAYLYFLYLYLDFSGYTDLAVGSSKLLQVEIPENFNLPFLARNPQDFWFRWHISLSKWLNDYVFTPTYTVLLKTFSSEYRVLLAAIAIFITFAFSGFWHGEELRFIREGFYHATFLFIFFFFDGYLKKNRPRTRKWMKDSTTVTLISRFATFHYVVGSFMVFSLDFATLKVVLKRLMGA